MQDNLSSPVYHIFALVFKEIKYNTVFDGLGVNISSGWLVV